MFAGAVNLRMRMRYRDNEKALTLCVGNIKMHAGPCSSIGSILVSVSFILGVFDVCPSLRVLDLIWADEWDALRLDVCLNDLRKCSLDT